MRTVITYKGAWCDAMLVVTASQPLGEALRRCGVHSDGDPSKIRTCDTWFRKPLLYPLSYGAKPFKALQAYRGQAARLCPAERSRLAV